MESAHLPPERECYIRETVVESDIRVVHAQSKRRGSIAALDGVVTFFEAIQLPNRRVAACHRDSGSHRIWCWSTFYTLAQTRRTKYTTSNMMPTTRAT
jgi:hypothetical protein